ncbi:hypothetical protein K7X08_005185 [Anisodus acutangulus]|uniref:Uncharacterized protein n=1 Tax=Anisodus acutangulus TaxID=402998 RepID=A0A9Q1RIW4_9SOLA|nr:hypothetical protein K7X08_005185 [Anisodus acutangulus]
MIVVKCSGCLYGDELQLYDPQNEEEEQSSTERSTTTEITEVQETPKKTAKDWLTITFTAEGAKEKVNKEVDTIDAIVSAMRAKENKSIVGVKAIKKHQEKENYSIIEEQNSINKVKVIDTTKQLYVSTVEGPKEKTISVMQDVDQQFQDDEHKNVKLPDDPKDTQVDNISIAVATNG